MKIWTKMESHREGKFLVVRRDGTVPVWPHFVMGVKDPAAAEALDAYAVAAARHGFDPEYVASIRELANDFFAYREEHGKSDPDAGPHRTDNSAVVAMMRGEGDLIDYGK